MGITESVEQLMPKLDLIFVGKLNEMSNSMFTSLNFEIDLIKYICPCTTIHYVGIFKKTRLGRSSGTPFSK